MKKPPKSRAELILNVLARKGAASLVVIVKAAGAGADEQKFFASVVLRLLQRGHVKRKKVNGAYVYRLSRGRAAASRAS